MQESLFEREKKKKKKKERKIANLFVVATLVNIHTGTIRTVKNIVLNSWLHGQM